MKKTISYLLIILAFILFPSIVNADESNVISSFDVTGVVFPIAGAKQDLSNVQLKANVDGITVVGSSYIKEPYYSFTDDMTFENGQLYTLEIEFSVKDGYTLDENANITSNESNFEKAVVDHRSQERNYIEITYKAASSCKVTLHIDNKNTNLNPTFLIKSGSTFAIPTEYANPTKFGFDFGGWYTDSSCSNKYDPASIITNDTTLYASWLLNPVVSFTVKNESIDLGTAEVGYNHWSYHDNVTLNNYGSVNLTYSKNDLQYFVCDISNQEFVGVKDAQYSKEVYPVDGLPVGTYNEDLIITGTYVSDTTKTVSKTIHLSFEVKDSSTTTSTNNVTFELNGGTMTSSNVVSVNIGEKVTKPEDPTRSGYKFDKWCSDSALTTEFDFNSTINSDTTIYAKWKKDIILLVSAGDNGKFTINDSQDQTRIHFTLSEGDTIKLKAKPNLGYEFNGWYSGITDTGTYVDHKGTELISSDNPYTFELKSDSTSYFYVEFLKINCTVTFDSQGGSSVASQTVSNGEAIVEPGEAPTKKGFVFGGWCIDSTCTTLYDFSTIVEKDFVLYAKWLEGPKLVGNSVYRTSSSTATVKFNANYADKYYYIVNSSSTAPTSAEIKAGTEGNSTVGLNTLSLDSLSSGSQYVHILLTKNGVESDVLTISMPYNIYYFEDFEANDIGDYISSGKLSPIKQINNGTGNSNQKVVNGLSEGKMLSLSSSGGWASDQIIPLNGLVPTAGRYIFEADVATQYSSSETDEWLLRFTLTNGSYGSPNREAGLHFEYNHVYEATQESTIIKDSFDKNTWYHVKIELYPTNKLYNIYIDGVKVAENLNIPNNIDRLAITAGHGYTAYYDNLKYYVDYSGLATVTYNTNGGSSISSQTIEEGTTISKPADPTKENSIFDGWYVDSILTTKFDFNTSITKDITLYAKWVHPHNLIEIYGHSATCETSGVLTYWMCPTCNKMFEDENGTTEISAPVEIPATGHNWGDYEITKEPTYESDGEKVRKCKNDPTHTETVVIPKLIARYAYFFAEGGTVSPTKKLIQVGNAIGDLPVPVKEGYTFDGWYAGSLIPIDDYNAFEDGYYGRHVLRISNGDPTGSGIFKKGYSLAFDVTINNTKPIGADISDIDLDSSYFTIDGNRIYGNILITDSLLNGKYSFLDINCENTITSYTVNYVKLTSNASTTSELYTSETQITEDKDISLVAKWTDKICKVTFETNCDTSIPVENVVYSKTVSKPAELTKDGYVFDDWYVDSTYTTKFDFTTEIKDDITLYAKWLEKIDEVNISFSKPKVGDIIKKQSGTSQTPQLSATIAEGSHYSYSGEMYWIDKLECEPNIIDNVEIKSNETYYIAAHVVADEGYIFTEDTIVKVNGVETNVKFLSPLKNGIEFGSSITPTNDYKVIKGENQTHIVSGNTDLEVTANGDVSKFVELRVNDVTLDKANYTIVSGSTIATLKQSYLDSLENGTYKLSFIYTDGECSTNFTIARANSGGSPSDTTVAASSGETVNLLTNSPLTGDYIYIVIGVLIITVVAIVVVEIKTKRKSNDE